MLEDLRRYEPVALEKRISDLWRERDIPVKVLSYRSGAPLYAFLEGPPTVNGFMHVGHARGRVYKDIVLRYKSMRGFDVWRRAGWDCQGLPTELEVEKRLQISSKKDLERIGLEKFVEEANKVIDYYISHWRAASEKLGLWLDYDNAYETRRNEYMEHVWALLKHAHSMGDLVESLRVVPTCPHCETPLSQHELAQGYEDIVDPSVYVKFPTSEANTYIVIWTTTPWTLPGNESVAVNPDSRYLVLETGGERWIVAEPTLQRFTSETGLPSYRVVEVRDGAQLVGLTYRHPLEDEVPYHKGHTHRVIAWHHVSMEEGTGCVHIAPAHGPDDFELAQENSLPVFCPVSASGIFTSEGGRYEGLSVDEASRMVLEDLKVKGLLVKSGEILHSYPLCWRCGTKLIYLASVQWFLKVDRIKNAMVEGNKNVKWWPEWAGRNRFGEWLANADDWCISRTKVWGTPLPVWRCESCGNKRVVGSRKELEEAVEKPSNPDLHRPWIDQYIFKCGICGGPMRRLPFVLDTWLDSGVAHLASVNGLHDPQLFQRLFPYDFVTEAIDQTRGWFYTLLFTSTLLYGRPPYKSVLNQGHVLDEYGKKMSKSRGNVIWAVDAFERYGVDPLRIYLVYKAEPWSTINFVPSEIALVREQLNILWNIFSFASTYFSLDNYRPWEHSPRDYLDSLLPEDRWILTRVNTVVGQITRFLEEMEINKAAKTLLDFIVEDISRTYVRAIRRRAWSEKASREKLAAYTCLSYALRKTVQMLAPFAPYLAEALYIRVRGPQEPESIHLSDWPSLDSDLTWPDVEKHMEVVREALTAILAARQRAGRKLRTPVQRIIISPKTSEALKALKYFEDYLMASSNCRKLQIMDIGGVPDGVRWELQPNLKVLGPKLGRRLPLLQEKLKMLDAREVLSQLRTGNVYIKLDDGSEVTLQPDDLTVKELIPPNFSTGECSSCKVYVDTELPTELGAVAAANEVIRRIQLMRKEADLNVLDRIECVVKVGDRDFARSLITQMEYIEEETRSRLEVVIEDLEAGEGFHWRSWKIDGVDTLIGIRKV